MTNVFVVNQRLWSTSFFVQDDWKATDALTREPRAALRLHDAAVRSRQPHGELRSDGQRRRGGLVFASDGSLEDRALVKPDKNNFAPRVGAVYKLGDRTILRGGYGIFYNQFERIGSEDQLALNPPGLRNIDVSAATGATTPVLLHAERLPGRLPRSAGHRAT